MRSLSLVWGLVLALVSSPIWAQTVLTTRTVLSVERGATLIGPGDPVTLRAEVTHGTAAARVTGGRVEFLADGEVVATGSPGVAVQVEGLAIGRRALRARFTGHGSLRASVSASVMVTVSMDTFGQRINVCEGGNTTVCSNPDMVFGPIRSPFSGFSVVFERGSPGSTAREIRLSTVRRDLNLGGARVDYTQVIAAEGDLTGAPAIAQTTARGRVIVWHERDLQGNRDVLLRQAAPGSEGFSDAIRVNAPTVGDHRNPRIAALTTGGYVVTYERRTGSTGYDIVFQRFDRNHQRLGSETLVNTRLTGDQGRQSVATLDTGDFVVLWFDEPSLTWRIRQFRSNGIARGDEVAVTAEALATADLRGGIAALRLPDQTTASHFVGFSQGPNLFSTFPSDTVMRRFVNTQAQGPWRSIRPPSNPHLTDVRILSAGRYLVTVCDWLLNGRMRPHLRLYSHLGVPLGDRDPLRDDTATIIRRVSMAQFTQPDGTPASAFGAAYERDGSVVVLFSLRLPEG